MSRRVKWLVILVLTLLVHTVYVVAAVAPGPQDSFTRVFPFGDLTASMLGSFLLPELALAVVLIAILAMLPWSDKTRTTGCLSSGGRDDRP